MSIRREEVSIEDPIHESHQKLEDLGQSNYRVCIRTYHNKS